VGINPQAENGGFPLRSFRG